MPENQKSKRRSFSAEFKQDAVDLVVKQGYSSSGYIRLCVTGVNNIKVKRPPSGICGIVVPMEGD